MQNIISSSLSDHITCKDYFLVDTFRSYLNNLSFWPLFFFFLPYGLFTTLLRTTEKLSDET